MNVKHIQILADAEADLEDGKLFYNSQAKGVGEYFWDCLLSDIESLVLYAGVHCKEYGYYRMPAKRFPYSIYYETKDEIASVIAVLPMRRNPKWIEEKMDNKS